MPYTSRHTLRSRPRTIAQALLLACLAGGAMYPVSQAVAQPTAGVQPGTARYDIPAGPLDRALNTLAETAGIVLAADGSLTAGKTSAALQGQYSVSQALDRLLAGSGLHYRFTGSNTVTLLAAASSSDAGPARLSPIRVGGGAIRDDGRAYSSDGSTTALGGDFGLAPKDTPVSSSAVSQQLMAEQDVQDLRAAVRNTPGVNFAGTYMNNYDNFRIRGFELPRINGYLRNGRPALHLHQDSFVSVERVEVLKGPASILYGNLAPGGVINIQTHQPIAERHASVSATAGLYDDYRAKVDGGNKIGAGDGAWRVVAGARDSKSFKDQVSSEEQTLYSTIRLPLGEVTTFSATAELHDAQRTIDGGIVSPGKTDPLGAAMTLPRSRFLGEPEGYGDYENRHLELELETLLAGWRLSALYSYASNERDVKQVRPNDYGWPSAFVNEDGRTVRRYTNAFIGDREWHNALVTLDNVVNTGLVEHHLNIGLSYRLEKTGGSSNSSIADWSSEPPNEEVVPYIDLYQPDYSAHAPFQYADRYDDLYSHYAGYYLQDAMHIGDKWVALLGLRWDEITDRDADEETDSFSPRVGVVYRVTDQLSVYTSYSESFEPIGGINDRTGARWDPAQGEQIEVGLKQSLFDDRALLTVAAYELTKLDELIDDPRDPQYQIQGGERSSRGVEVELAGQIGAKLDVRAGYSYMDTEIEQTDIASHQDNEFGEVPEHRANLWMGYQLQPDLRIGGGVFYTGSQYIDDANSLKLDSYTVADVFARYDISGDTHVRLTVKNIFDKKYFTQANNWSYPGGSGLQFGEPMHWNVHIEHHF